MKSGLEKVKNTVRNLLTIRQKRQAAPVGTKPIVDSYICHNNLKMLVTHELEDELWQWLAQRGWRKITVPNDRRQYRYLPIKAFKVLVRAPEEELESVYQRVMAARTRSRPPSESSEHAEPSLKKDG